MTKSKRASAIKQFQKEMNEKVFECAINSLSSMPNQRNILKGKGLEFNTKLK